MELVDAAVAGQSEAGGAGLDGPDAAAVVAERVVGGVVGGEGPDSPAAEEVGSKQSAGDGVGDASRDDAGGQQVPVVGVDRADLSLVGA